MRKKEGAPFSLFAFQDAITSVCGVVVLVTLLLALNLTRQAAEETQTAYVAQERVEETRREVEELRAMLEESERKWDESFADKSELLGMDISEAQERVAEARERLEKERAVAAELDARLAEAQSKAAQFEEERKEIDAMRKETEAMKNAAFESVYSGTETTYVFPSDVEEKPWFVEIMKGKIVARSSANEADAKVFDSPFSFTTWAEKRPKTEYFVLIARPSGVKDFSFVKTEFDGENIRYGIDLIGEKTPLVFQQEATP